MKPENLVEELVQELVLVQVDLDRLLQREASETLSINQLSTLVNTMAMILKIITSKDSLVKLVQTEGGVGTLTNA